MKEESSPVYSLRKGNDLVKVNAERHKKWFKRRVDQNGCEITRNSVVL